ncbi:KCH1 [Candida margitis]|uniref:KCH1 n=1 Tax=Candida margitis TaxID=1775924 RepID=UPI0022260B85|nr:KCH1 [Candida margitis]KAI5970793.1 KCH1 [Candida margitis]
MQDKSLKDHLDAERAIKKYHLNTSTFDVVRVDDFHNHNCSTIQVINILTLRYYATGGDLNNDILSNIRSIAKTNLRLSIILSFMCLSVFIYAIFFFKFLFGMLSYVPLKVSLSNEGYNGFKSYCSYLVNKSVADAVNKHHRPKKELREEGLLSEAAISQLPQIDEYPSDYKGYTRVYYGRSESEESIAMQNFSSNGAKPYNDSKSELYQQPSFDQLQQSEQVFSTLGGGNVPFSKRLGSLQEKNRNRVFGNPQVAGSTSSLTYTQPKAQYECLKRAEPLPHVDTANDLHYCKQRSRSYNKPMEGDDLQDESQGRMPSFPTRSYTAETLYDRNNQAQVDSQIDLLSTDLIYESGNHIATEQDNTTTEPWNSSKPFVDYQSINAPNRKPVPRSFTEESHKTSKYTPQDPFVEEDDNQFLYEQPSVPELEIEHGSPKSQNSGEVDKILDAYDTNGSAPYPVRGVSKFFEN